MLAAAAGFALPSAHALVSGTAMLRAPTAAMIFGTVAAREQSGPDRQTVFLALDHTDAPARLAGIRTVRLTLDGADPVLPGSALTVRARFFQVPGPVAPGGYLSSIPITMSPPATA